MTNYQEIATKARKKVLEMIFKAQTSHIGSNFSCIDILAVLFEKMDLEKDKFIASKGWIAASVYYFLAEKGIIPKKDLERYCQPNETEYIGLIEPRGKFGLEFAGGSMCMGIAAGVGFALAKKIKGEEGKVYVLESDGGMQGGITWEAAQIAAHHKLDNLMVIVDDNKLQATGKTNEILDIKPLENKWREFNWRVYRLNGHVYEAIERVLEYAEPLSKKDYPNCEDCDWPAIIIADTIKGKGVSFMENNNLYHYKNLSKVEYKEALKELV